MTNPLPDDVGHSSINMQNNIDSAPHINISLVCDPPTAAPTPQSGDCPPTAHARRVRQTLMIRSAAPSVSRPWPKFSQR